MLIEGTFFNDTLNGTNGDDTLQGNGGNDTLFGNQGNDQLEGGTGNDELFGGAGNDLFVLEVFQDTFASETLDIVADFEQGTDKIDVSHLGISDFNTILATTEDDDNNNVVFNIQAGHSQGRFYSFRINGLSKNQLQTTDFNFSTDTQNRNLQGSISFGFDTFNNYLFGALGDDTLNGLGGNDRLFGDQGNDVLRGGLGNDELFGGEGNDLFVLEIFEDTFSADNLDIVADFDQGEDKIDVSHLGISDFNTILAIAEDDENGNVVLKIQSGHSEEQFYSLRIDGISKHQLQATDFNFSTDTQNRNLQGSISFSFDTFNDYLFGALGNDTLNGLDGNDRLFGDQGNDVLRGGEGNDILFGGAGNDLFVLHYPEGILSIDDLDIVADFEQGADKIDVSHLGITDFNTLLAISEDDENGNVVFTVRYENGSSSLRINGLSKNQLQATDFNYGTNTENQIITGTSFVDDLFGSVGNDQLISGDGNDRLFGGEGNDLLSGGEDNDILFGGAGNDLFVLHYPEGILSIDDFDIVADFEQGADKIDVSHLGITDFNTLLAISEDDENGNVVFTVRYENGSSSLRINGLSKNQLQATDFNYGTNTENQIITGTSFVDDLFGSVGNDQLISGDGNDRLFGDQGNDLLSGGEGSDLLFGGAGNDLFVLHYPEGILSIDDLDIVADFEQGVDKIDVSHLGITDFNTLLAISEDDENGNVVFTVRYENGSSSLRINDLSKNQLQATDFNYGTNAENQIITGTLFVDDLFGSVGNDGLVSGDENDRLFGDQGNDILIGGYNSDLFFGGAGNDSFALEYFQNAIERFTDLARILELEWETPEQLFILIRQTGFDAINQLDVVRDFVLGVDKIDVSRMVIIDPDDPDTTIGISDFNTIMAIAEDDENGNVVFKTRYFHRTNDAFYALRIDGVSKNQLQATDFIFSTNTKDKILEGTLYQDDLFGGLGNDVLTGGLAAEDVVALGNPGVNRLFGGAGVDTATFSGNLASYNIEVVGNALRVESFGAIDLLYDIEQLQFADQTIANPINPPNDNPPVIGTPINDFEVEEDADNTIIDLADLFNDADNDDIIATVFANSNPDLVTPIIDGNNLTLNYQENQSGTAEITIRGTANDQFIDEVFTVTVNEVNDVPTDLTISDITINENQPINTTIGTFDTTDNDTGETFTYRLVAGDGDTDNDLFIIDGNTLRTNTIFDFETQNTYSIRVETIDSANNTYSKSILINIGDVNETISTLDIDGNGFLQQQDYNLINLYSSNLDASEFDFLINNFSNDLIGENATRADANSILTYLNEVGDTLLDIDGNNQVEQQDYNLINLYASQLDAVELGFLIENFTNDLIGDNATRTDADAILAYFDTFVPETV